MPIRGFVRMRRHQFGKQSVLQDPVAATRRVGARGVPSIVPNWTDPENVDTGYIDPYLPPYRMGLETTMPLAFDPLAYNDIPLVMSALLRGGVAPVAGGAGSFEWQHAGVSNVPTVLDQYTDEFGDDVNKNDDTLEDSFQLIGGIVQAAEWSFDANLGPWVLTSDWLFAGANYPVTPTPGLVLPDDSIWAYGEDTALFIDDAAGSIGTTKIVDSLIGCTVRIENVIDEKRYANGPAATPEERFVVDGFGVAGRTITMTARFEKTAQIVDSLGETAKWLNADPTNRFVQVKTTSQAEAEPGVPYDWAQNFSGTWRTRTESEEGGNAVVELSMTGRYDTDLGYPYQSDVVNTQDDTP